MGYKKQQWEYFGSKNYGFKTFEIIVRDETGAKIESLRFKNNPDQFRQVITILKNKYGLVIKDKRIKI